MPLFELRKSPISGTGAFAIARIPRRTPIIEYQGERISPAEGNRRYDGDRRHLAHVLLFYINKTTLIDAGVNGNDARFINHSCAPNCETVLRKGGIWIKSLRRIRPGEELTYDYAFSRADLGALENDARYACNCGATTCRGTMFK